MLLIAFYGKFYSFYKLFMPKLLSQSKHEEFKSNSALHIRDQKERRVENAKKLELQENFRSMQNFRRLHCSSYEISFMLHCSSCSTVHHFATIHLSYCFTLLPFCYNFLFLPILSLVIPFDFGSFCNFAWLGQYISSCIVIKENFLLSNKIGGKLSAFPLFLLFSTLSLIFSPFLGCQTPSKDDNLEDERLKPFLP